MFRTIPPVSRTPLVRVLTTTTYTMIVTMSRLLRFALLFSFCSVASLSAQTPQATAKKDVKPLKVLLITGGCCHDYDKQKDILKKGLEERANVEVTVHYNPDKGTKAKFEVYSKSNWSEGYDCIVHNECNADVKETDFIENILKPHREGLPSVVIHCTMHCYRDEKGFKDGTNEWFKYVGVTTRGHGPHYAFKIVNLDRENPILKTFPAEWTTPKGELYHIDKVAETAKVLAHGERVNPKETTSKVLAQDACIWTNQYGKGRVFGTTVGHYNEEMSDPIYLDYVTRGLLWSCDKLNDDYLKANKAAAQVAPAAVESAPQPQPTLAPVSSNETRANLEVSVAVKKN
ncbi:MAG: ThuA domain-containing protein [Pirellulales bacterium]